MKTSFLAIMLVVIVGGRFSLATAEFKPGVKVKGKMFIHWYGDLSDSPALKYEGLAIDRAYVTLKGAVSENVSTRVTLDVNPKATDYKYMYLKYAYAEYKVVEGMLTITAGQQASPWVGFAEKAWKYRSFMKVLPDFNKVIGSTDMGVGARVKFPSKMGEAILQVLNGAGYKNTNGDEEKDYRKDIAGRVTLTPLQGNEALKPLGISLGIHNKNLVGEDDMLIQGLLSYGRKPVSAGVEILNVMGKGTTDKFGVSIFADAGFKVSDKVKDIGLLVRYDIFDPDKATADDGTNALAVGPRVKISKHTLALVYEMHGTESAGGTDTKLVKAVLEAKF